jgi:integrase/recombinase XerC
VASVIGEPGGPVVRREELPAKAPRALSVEQQRRVLRIAEHVSARDRAILVLLLYTALRLAELVALDLDDVRTSARKGVVIVRSGKGDAFREVPFNALARQVLEEWPPERKRLAGAGERALFIGRGGRRLAKRSVDDVVRGIGKDAGVRRSAPGRRRSAQHRKPHARRCLPSRAGRHDRGAGPRCRVRSHWAGRTRQGG